MTIPNDVTLFKLERLPKSDPLDCFYKLEFGFANFRTRAEVQSIAVHLVSTALGRTDVVILNNVTTGKDGPHGWWFFSTIEVAVRKTKIEEERGI